MRRPLTERERRGAALIILTWVLAAAYWLLIDSWFAGPLRDINAQAQGLREQQQRYAGVLQHREALQRQFKRREMTRRATAVCCRATTRAP